MEMSESIGALVGALAKAQTEFDSVRKSSTNPHFKSKYADLSVVADAVTPALNANGLVVVQTTEAGTGDNVTVVTTLCHTSGEWMRGRLTMKPVKADPQGIGSCITYARRYALAAIVGVAPEDDDGEAASGRTNGKQAKPVAAAPPPPQHDPNGEVTDSLWAEVGKAYHATGRTPTNWKIDMSNALGQAVASKAEVTADMLRQFLASLKTAA